MENAFIGKLRSMGRDIRSNGQRNCKEYWDKEKDSNNKCSNKNNRSIKEQRKHDGESMKMGNNFWPNVAMKIRYFTHLLNQVPQNSSMPCEYRHGIKNKL